MNRTLFGIQVSEDEFKYIQPMVATIGASVDELKMPAFWSRLMKACAVASLVEHKGKMRNFPSEMAYLQSVKHFIFSEFEKAKSLIETMEPHELHGASLKIGSVELWFD